MLGEGLGGGACLEALTWRSPRSPAEPHLLQQVVRPGALGLGACVHACMHTCQ